MDIQQHEEDVFLGSIDYVEKFYLKMINVIEIFKDQLLKLNNHQFINMFSFA